MPKIYIGCMLISFRFSLTLIQEVSSSYGALSGNTPMGSRDLIRVVVFAQSALLHPIQPSNNLVLQLSSLFAMCKFCVQSLRNSMYKDHKEGATWSVYKKSASK